MKRLASILLSFGLILLPLVAVAHELDPGYLELSMQQEGQWRVTFRVPDVSGLPMSLGARLPEECADSGRPPPSFDGRAWVSAWVTFCPGGITGGEIAIDGLESTRTDALVRYELEPGRIQVRRLTNIEPRFTVPADPGAAGIFASYVALGVTHILDGVDHLLFVFALLLLVRKHVRLFWAVTAFTAAHSLTLAAASLGWLNVATPPVEVVIALSIVFLAYELTLPPEARDPFAERYPWIVSFAFGLIHGLGFAGALREIGLPDGDIPLALLSFNIGVELGQILFIALVLVLGAITQRLFPVLRRQAGALSRVAGYGIGTMATFWVIERVAMF